MRILSGHWKLSLRERCPYQEVRLYQIVHKLYAKHGIGSFFSNLEQLQAA